MTQDTALSILKLGHTTFLTGAAGSGKSYVLRQFITHLREHGISYAVTASTGIASTHINGTTIHAWSGIGVRDHLTLRDLDALEEKQPLYKKWTGTEVLVIDEVSMLSANFLSMLNTLAKHMRRNDEPFGGMQVVFCGDFFQLPPVVRGMADANEPIFAFQSSAWKEAKPVVCYLTEQHRQDDDELTVLLGAIRDSATNEYHYDLVMERNGKELTGEYIKLYTHNENVDRINDEAYQMLKGEDHVYHMTTRGKGAILEALKKNCLADEKLLLKRGAKVICIKNAQDRSYVNGSLGVVTGFDKENAPVVTLTNGKVVTIQADSWKIEEEGKVKAEITQLPLKLAWAITVHKSQGMTLDQAEIDLSKTFVEGQGYVALSRLRSLKGLSLKGLNRMAFAVNSLVKEEDVLFVKKSLQAEQAITKYSVVTLKGLHDKAIHKLGGTLEKKELHGDEDDIPIKVPSHMHTKELLDSGKTIDDVASERGLSVDTIVGHIEKLAETGEQVKLDHTLPPKNVQKRIQKAFDECKSDKLSPVFEYLNGSVPYLEIRLVRVYNSLSKVQKREK